MPTSSPPLNDLLTSRLLHQAQPLTVRHLCRLSDVSISTARDAMAAFHAKHKDRITALWAIVGELKPVPSSSQNDDEAMDVDLEQSQDEEAQARQETRDVKRQAIRLVDDETLQATLSSLATVTTQHLHSLLPRKSSTAPPTSHLSLLTTLHFEEHTKKELQANWERSAWGANWGAIAIQGGVKERVKGAGLSGSASHAASASSKPAAVAVKTEPGSKDTKLSTSTSTSSITPASKSTSTSSGGLNWGKARAKTTPTSTKVRTEGGSSSGASSSTAKKRKATIADSEEEDEDEASVAGAQDEEEEEEEEDDGGAIGYADGDAAETPMQVDDDDDGEPGVKAKSKPKLSGTKSGSRKVEQPSIKKGSATKKGVKASQDEADADVPMAESTTASSMRPKEGEGCKDGETKAKRRVRKTRKVTRKEKTKNARGYTTMVDVEGYESYTSDESDDEDGGGATVSGSSKKPVKDVAPSSSASNTSSRKPKPQARPSVASSDKPAPTAAAAKSQSQSQTSSATTSIDSAKPARGSLKKDVSPPSPAPAPATATANNESQGSNSSRGGGGAASQSKLSAFFGKAAIGEPKK